MKKLIAILLLIGAVSIPSVVSAFPGDLRYIIRNEDDSEDVIRGMPTSATGSPRLMGGRPEQDHLNWYYFAPSFTVTATSVPQGNDIAGAGWAIDVGNLSLSQVVGLNAALDAKVGVTTLEASTNNLLSLISGKASTTHSHTIGDVSTLQTVLNGLLTGKASTTHSHAIADVTNLQTTLNSKFNTPSGTTAQYIRGDGSLATLPAGSGTGTVSSVGLSSTDFSISGSPINGSGVITANLGTSGVSAGTYSGVTVTNKGIVTAGTNRTFNNNVSRTLNSNYTISTTRDACVSYSINASWAINALLSGTGSAFLEYSLDSGSNWITVNNVGKTLNLLTFAGGDDMNLMGCVPANALARIRTTASNMTITYTRGQETYM